MELNNGIIRFIFDENTGNVAQITDIAADYDYLSDAKGNRLFNLIVPTPTFISREVRSDKAGKPVISLSEGTITITYPDIVIGGDATGITAVVKAYLPSNSTEARFSIHIDNNGPYRIHEVHCPWIGGWTGYGGKGVDKLTVSGTQADPHAMFPTHRTHTWGRWNMRKYYGGVFFLPFLDLSGDGHGMSYCIYTTVPRICGILLDDLSPDYNKTCLSWTYVAQPYIKPGDKWDSPEVGISIHCGDWHDTVDLYREFVESWWTAPPTPHRLREITGYFNAQTTGFVGDFCHDWTEVPEIARDCMKYGVSDLCIWDLYAQVYSRPDNGGIWEMPEEYERKMRTALAKTNEMGCNTSTCVNYRLITQRCKDFLNLETETVKSLYGYSNYAESYPISWTHAQWRTYTLDAGGLTLCQSSPKFYKYAMDISRKTLELGFTSLFIDQVSEWNPCFDENHGHESPDDTLEHAYRWMNDVANMVREHSPESYVVGELPEIFNTQFLDLSFDWGKRDVNKAEVIRYLLPDSLQMWCIDEHERDVVSKAFASGHILALMTHELTGKLSDVPELAEHVARLAELKKQTLPYLAYGRFMDNRGLYCEGATGYTYTSEAGLAVPLANSEANEVTAKVKLNPLALKKSPGKYGLLYSEDGQVNEQALDWDGDNLVLEAIIPAYAAAVWCIPCL